MTNGPPRRKDTRLFFHFSIGEIRTTTSTTSGTVLGVIFGLPLLLKHQVFVLAIHDKSKTNKQEQDDANRGIYPHCRHILHCLLIIGAKESETAMNRKKANRFPKMVRFHDFLTFWCVTMELPFFNSAKSVCFWFCFMMAITEALTSTGHAPLASSKQRVPTPAEGPGKAHHASALPPYLLNPRRLAASHSRAQALRHRRRRYPRQAETVALAELSEAGQAEALAALYLPHSSGTWWRHPPTHAPAASGGGISRPPHLR
ncbi:hypothetical protein SEVIR_4G116432v4 [Setaria viridis]